MKFYVLLDPESDKPMVKLGIESTDAGDHIAGQVYVKENDAREAAEFVGLRHARAELSIGEPIERRST